MPIVRNIQICGGAPTLAGRRIMVANLIFRAKVDGIEVTQRDLGLSASSIEEAIAYCSDLKCIQEFEELPLCEHCTLRGLSPHYLKASGFLESKDPSTIQLEEKSDCWHNWILASEIQDNIK